MTRCKFVCTEAGKSAGWTKENPVLHFARLSPVSNTGSEENKKFWEASPSGFFEIKVVKFQPFEVGKEYYFDISEA